MHHYMLLFTFQYFSDPSDSNLFILSSLLLSHRSRMSAMTQDFIPTGSPSRGGDVVYVFDISQPSLPTFLFGDLPAE